jgi:hypothetical protein
MRQRTAGGFQTQVGKPILLAVTGDSGDSIAAHSGNGSTVAAAAAVAVAVQHAPEDSRRLCVMPAAIR